MNKEKWQADARHAIVRWARMSRGGQFNWTAEQIRGWAKSHMDSEPNDLRWWGTAFKMAIQDGVLIRSGWGVAKSSHNSPKRKYKSAY